jgi:hypothetical protein
MTGTWIPPAIGVVGPLAKPDTAMKPTIGIAMSRV